jgi:integrase
MTPMQDFIDPFLDSLYVQGSSPQTVRAYHSDLINLNRWLEDQPGSPRLFREIMADPRKLEAEIARYLNESRKTYAAATIHRRCCTFRRFGEFIFPGSEFLANYRAPTPPKGVAHPLPTGIEGVRDMLNATYKSHHRAIIALQGLCGLRISEVLNLQVEDVLLDASGAPQRLRIRGKGDKVRIVPLSDEAIVYLKPVLRRGGSGWLFHINERSARKAITRTGMRALGIPVASHDLRMTFGTEAYRKSKNLRAVQEFLGHASSSTTETYTGVSMDEMAEIGDFS